VAPGPITDEFLRRQASDGYNSVMLGDLAGWNAATRTWQRPDDVAIAQQLELARAYDFSILLEIPAVVGIPPAVAGGASELVALSDAELRERVELWNRYGQTEIVGIFFVPDDPFYLGIAASDMRRWSGISRQIAPELPILGMAGEYALSMPPEQRAMHWAPDAHDGLLLLNYPYNLGSVWGHPLDHETSPDPDAALAAYEADYVEAMRQALLKDLRPDQIVVPVIQTFYYAGDASGSIPRQRDIELQPRLLHAAMQSSLGQRDNYAMAYYYAGPDGAADPFEIPQGIYNVPSWPETVARENEGLEAEFNASLLPATRRRSSRH
jgi:hypothetical protein